MSDKLDGIVKELRAALEAKDSLPLDIDKYGHKFQATAHFNFLARKHMSTILDALAAKDLEIERLRGALGRTDTFIEYARYELESDGGDWKQFPDQKDADKCRAMIAEALNPSKEGGSDAD